MNLLNPVSDIRQEIVANGPGVGPVKIESLAPLTSVAVCEIVASVLCQVVPIWTKVVVNHIEDHPKTNLMGPINKVTETLWPTVKPSGSKQVNAIVAPTKATGEIRQRHNLQNRNATVSQFVQFSLSGVPGSFFRERADVHFVEHLAFGANAIPILICPFEINRIDYLGRAMRALWLKTRGGIRIPLGSSIQAESVLHNRVSLCNVTGKIAIILGLESAANLVTRAVIFRFHNHVYVLAVRRPHSEMDSSFRHYLCTNG